MGRIVSAVFSVLHSRFIVNGGPSDGFTTVRDYRGASGAAKNIATVMGAAGPETLERMASRGLSGRCLYP